MITTYLTLANWTQMDLISKHIYLGTVGFRIASGLLHMLDLCEFQLHLRVYSPSNFEYSWGCSTTSLTYTSLFPHPQLHRVLWFVAQSAPAFRYVVVLNLFIIAHCDTSYLQLKCMQNLGLNGHPLSSASLLFF